jgi:hypothetical protein
MKVISHYVVWNLAATDVAPLSAAKATLALHLKDAWIARQFGQPVGSEDNSFAWMLCVHRMVDTLVNGKLKYILHFAA